MTSTSYRHDPDLEFLKNVPSADLEGLVSTLTHDKDGSVRWTEALTTKEEYKKHFPDHNKYWDLVAGELQGFGANSFATIFRGGKGVLYKEVLCDVCDKLKVNYSKYGSTELIEQNLMMKIVESAVQRMSAEEVRQMAEEAGVANIGALSKDAALAAFIAIFRAGGFKSYQILVIVVNATLKAMIGRGLSFAGSATMTRTASLLAGPIGWVITGVWTAFDIASPAYRVTIPAVIQVIALRQKMIADGVAD